MLEDIRDAMHRKEKDVKKRRKSDSSDAKKKYMMGMAFYEHMPYYFHQNMFPHNPVNPLTNMQMSMQNSLHMNHMFFQNNPYK